MPFSDDSEFQKVCQKSAAEGSAVQCVVCTPKAKRLRNLNFDLVGDVAWLFQLLLQIFIFPLVVS